MLNFSGFEGALSAPCVGVANAAFFGFPELGFRWCLAACAMFIVQLVPCLILADSKVLFRHHVSGLRTQRFLAFLSLDLDGV